MSSCWLLLTMFAVREQGRKYQFLVLLKPRQLRWWLTQSATALSA